jgi:hypothetical protein
MFRAYFAMPDVCVCESYDALGSACSALQLLGFNGLFFPAERTPIVHCDAFRVTRRMERVIAALHYHCICVILYDIVQADRAIKFLVKLNKCGRSTVAIARVWVHN